MKYKGFTATNSLLVLFVLLLGTSCGKSELWSEDIEQSEGIAFGIKASPFSRSIAINDAVTLAEKSTIKVTALRYDGSWATLTSTPDAYMADVTLSGTKQDVSTVTWSYLPVKPWPVGKRLAFFAVAGNGAELNTSTEAPYYPLYSVSAGDDVMVATPQLDKISGSVNLQFSHILSRIGFSFKLASALPTSISSVRVTNIYVSGIDGAYSAATYRYSGSSYAWDYTNATAYPADSKISFSANNTMLTTEFKDISTPEGYYFMIPQDISTKPLEANVSYEVTPQDGDPYIGSAKITFTPKQAWVAGEAYNYNGVLNLDTHSIIIYPGNNYTETSPTGLVDAHMDSQPVYLSANAGYAKISLPSTDISWATLSLFSSDGSNPNYTLSGDKSTLFVSFTEGNGSTNVDRQLIINFADNAPAAATSFSNRDTHLDIEYFADATSSVSLGTLTQKTTLQYHQSAPYYVGVFGDYFLDGTYGSFRKGLVMENFTEYNIDNFKGDNLLLKSSGLSFWSGNISGLTLPLSDYQGLLNTTTLTAIGDVNNGGITPTDFRFNTYAARYCKEKGNGWHLPSPQQMRVLASFDPTAFTPVVQPVNPISNGTYWTSKAITASNAAVVTKTSSSVTINATTGVANSTSHQIRCVKEVAVNTSQQIKQNGDGTVNLDTGSGKIVLDNFIGNANENWNTVSSTQKPVCIAPWRLATIEELVYLFRVDAMLPLANRSGLYNYFTSSKIGGAAAGVEVSSLSPLGYNINTTVSNGQWKGTHRCVRDLP